MFLTKEGGSVLSLQENISGQEQLLSQTSSTHDPLPEEEEQEFCLLSLSPEYLTLNNAPLVFIFERKYSAFSDTIH